MNRLLLFGQGLLPGLALCLSLSACGGPEAELRLPLIFSDGMVLQQGMNAPVWGWAGPEDEVIVRIAGQERRATADSLGRWSVRLEPLTAGGPHELTVESAGQTLVVTEVLVGEVWLASGQSNMAMEVESCLNPETELAAADFPQIRQFQPRRVKAAAPLQDLPAPDSADAGWLCRWEAATPETAAHFTGVGFFFARELHQKLGVPVGIINSAWGGTACEAWTPLGTIESDPRLSSILTDWPKYNDEEEWLQGEYAKFLAEVEQAKQAGIEAPLYFCQPSVLYNGMIAPLAGYGLRGALWYQGEANCYRHEQYRALFPAMIGSWREAWGQGDFPFLFVQLAGYEHGSGSWPAIREAQAAALALPNTAMATAIDVGEAGDIHPKNKQAVGHRLALAAGALADGEQLEYAGPACAGLTVEGGKAALSFTSVGEGLVTSDGGAEPGGFLIAGEDRVFQPAQATIEGERLVVWSPQVKAPVAVRYAWADYPAGANLCSMVAGRPYLPAPLFAPMTGSCRKLTVPDQGRTV